MRAIDRPDRPKTRPSISTKPIGHVPDLDPEVHEDAVAALVQTYDQPPYDIEREAYLELALTIAELVAGDGELPRDGHQRRLSAGRIYSSLSPDTRAEVDPSRGGIGITSVRSVPAVFTAEREKYKKTLYKVGPRLAIAHTATGYWYPTATASEIAEAIGQLASTGDVEREEILRAAPGGELRASEDPAEQRRDGGPQEGTADETGRDNQHSCPDGTVPTNGTHTGDRSHQRRPPKQGRTARRRTEKVAWHEDRTPADRKHPTGGTGKEQTGTGDSAGKDAGDRTRRRTRPTAIESTANLADADRNQAAAEPDRAVKSAHFVSQRRYNGVGPVLGGWPPADTRASCRDTRPSCRHHSAAVRQRVDLLPEAEIEALLSRSPLASFPRTDLPTELYEDIIEWRPILAEAEPLAAVLQMSLMARRRDEDWCTGGDCVGMVFDHESIFAAFGTAPSTAYNRGLNSGMLLELYRRKVDPEFGWTGWHARAGKARVIRSHGIPDEIVQAAKTVMLGPEDYDDWTYLISGKSASNRRWTSQIREERRQRIAAHETVIEPPAATRRIQEYLNGLEQQYFGHGSHGNLRPSKLDEAIRTVADTIGDERRRDQERRKLFWIRKFPQPLYLPCDRFPRLKADPPNQAMNLPSVVLRSMYIGRDYELDLSKAHLASYVPVAKREGLDVPVLERYLQANLESDEALLKDGDLWTDLAMSVDTEVFGDLEALRSAVKRSYSAVYGSGRQNLLYRVYEKYGTLTGRYPGEGLDPLRPLLAHPLMEELLQTRDVLELIVNDRGGLEDATGRLIPLSAWDETKKTENRWRGVMAYVNASFEQELMAALVDEARTEIDRDGETRFKVWLYQADGVTVRINRRYAHAPQIDRLQSAVAAEAERLGVPTELEVDWAG